MKRSIKRQMIVLFTGLIVCVFVVLFVVNLKFLGPYYIQNKETELSLIHIFGSFAPDTV